MTNTQKLEQAIEKLVRAHIMASRTAATAAVERAFAASLNESATIERRPKATIGVRSQRRSPEELTLLDERLHAAICERPGETMTVLAARLGVPTRSLQVPVKRLKRTERLRSVGQRPYTRYFPLLKDEPQGRTSLVAVGSGS